MKILTSRNIQWAAHVAHTEKMRNVWNMFQPDSMKRRCLADVSVDKPTLRRILNTLCEWRGGRNSSVDIATTGWKVRNQTPVEPKYSASIYTGPGAHPLQCSVHRVSFPGIKRSWHGVNHSPPYSTEFKETVELNTYFPTVPSWRVVG
jgi:hypothetical protein